MTSLDTDAGRDIAIRTRAPRTDGPGFGRVLALAFREMRGGIRGFQVFIACVALGVMVITAVTALSDALTHGLERQGELILGGDATLARSHARASESELQWLAARGRLSETATMRTMGRSLDGEEQALAELKGVDAAYPLVGSVALDGGVSFPDAIRPEGGVRRAAVDPILLERLGIKIGGRFRVGELELVASAAIVSEPDGISDRMTFGPRIFVDLPTLEATGLVKPGSLVRWRYSLQIDEPGVAATAQSNADRASVASFAAAVKRDLPEAGYTVLDKRDPSPRVRKTLERLRQFLTLIGLTALLVGGVGVANAVQTFVDRRRKVIATMKSLGAPSRLVFQIFFIQVAIMAALGVLIGLVLGQIVPLGLHAFFADALPFPADVEISPWSLVTGAACGDDTAAGTAGLHGRGMRLPPRAHVHLVAARTGRARFSRRTVPRRDRRPAWLAAPPPRRRDRDDCVGACRVRGAVVGFAAHRALVRRRPDGDLRGVPRTRPCGHLGRPAPAANPRA